jgi:hypothetical protein
MKKIILGFIASTLFSFNVLAESIALQTDHPSEYTVKRGDTLWDISSTFLREPWLWPEIWHINRQIKNPHLIYPGDVIKLVYVNGEPRLVLASASGSTRSASNGTEKLLPRVRSTPIETVIPAIPLDAVRGFLDESRVLDKETLEKAPYVVAGNEKHVIIGVGDYFYARGDWSAPAPAYGVYRQGAPYVDPVTQEVLGYDAKELGMGKIITVTNDLAKTELVRSRQELRVNDRLLPTEERKVQPVFYPSAPDDDLKGQIIRVMSGVKNVAQYDVVVINQGIREGVEEGNVFAIYRKGESVRDKNTKELLQLPSERAGLLMVFRTFDKVSYGLVLKATSSMAVLDEVRKP